MNQCHQSNQMKPDKKRSFVKNGFLKSVKFKDKIKIIIKNII